MWISGTGPVEDLPWNIHDSAEKPMTLLGAVRTDSGAWIGSDSLLLHHYAGYGEPWPKIFRYRSQQLAWGWFGSSDQGDDFELYVNSIGRDLYTWDDLSGMVANVVTQHDLQARGQRFGAVFAGYLGNTFGFRAFARFPLKGEDPNGEWAFMGANRLPAQVGWLLTSDNPDPEDRFRKVMQTTIDNSHGVLDPPLQIWRVTKDYCGPAEQTD
jgi:hypothetical protein